jgi:hypothetical protein
VSGPWRPGSLAASRYHPTRPVAAHWCAAGSNGHWADSFCCSAADLKTGAYTQHYYDSRGVVRLYVMSLAEGVWTLSRESPDFTPLEFRQRFIGTFSEDQNTISGAWETGRNGASWEHDFALTYRRIG